MVDYGMDSAGGFINPPGEPKTGHGPYKAFQLNQRSDLDNNLNANSSAWLAMEAWVQAECPDKKIVDPSPPPGATVSGVSANTTTTVSSVPYVYIQPTW